MNFHQSQPHLYIVFVRACVHIYYFLSQDISNDTQIITSDCNLTSCKYVTALEDFHVFRRFN